MPIYLIMASSSSIDFSWVTWENVLEKTGLVLDQTKCSLLKTDFPEVHIFFFHLTEKIQLFNLKECFKFTEDEARQILEACDSVQVDAPEVKVQTAGPTQLISPLSDA